MVGDGGETPPLSLAGTVAALLPVFHAAALGFLTKACWQLQQIA